MRLLRSSDPDPYRLAPGLQSTSGTITSGTFPSGSFIIGTTVTLVIDSGNSTVAFHGTANPTTGQISGNYTVVGGGCDQTGTAVLDASSPWDY